MWASPNCGRPCTQAHAITWGKKSEGYAKFITSLKSSPSAKVAITANILIRDARSNTGANVRFLTRETAVDPSQGSNAVRLGLCDPLCQPDEREDWEVKLLSKIAGRKGRHVRT